MKNPYTTDELMAAVGGKPQTARAGLCRDGHYLGIVPIKLPNRRLVWPADQVERVLRGEPARPDSMAPTSPQSPDWRDRIKQAGSAGKGVSR